MRFGFWLIIVAIAMLWGGGQSLYTALSNRTPTTMTCAAYLDKPVEAEWLELTECEMDVTEAAYSGFGDHATELFIPVRAVGGDRTAKTSIILASKDDERLEIIRQMLEAGDDEEKVTQLLVTHVEDLFFTGSVRGLVQFGIELDDDDKEELAALDDNLSKEFIILEDGAEPSLAMGLTFTGIGTALVVGFIVSIVRRKKPEEASDEPAAAP